MMLWSYLTMAIIVTYSLSSLCSFMAFDIVNTDLGETGQGVSASFIGTIQLNWFAMIAK